MACRLCADFLEDTCRAKLRTACKSVDHGDANAQIILQSFPDLLDLPLDQITALKLKEWRNAQISARVTRARKPGAVAMFFTD